MRRALCVSVAADTLPASGSRTAEPNARHSTDVVVAIDPQHPIEELRVALASATGAPADSVLELARSGRVPRSDRVLADVDIVDGDTLTLRRADRLDDGSAPPTPKPDRFVGGGIIGGGLPVLEVLSGPEAQRSYALRSGVNRVGRSFEADIQLGDEYVSRDELEVVVGEAGTVQIVPTRTANGVVVNGTLIEKPIALASADVVAVGNSRFVVRTPVVAPGRLYPGFGTIDFFRTPYRNEQPTDPGIELFDSVPKEVKPSRLGLIMIITPLLGGIGMYMMTRRAMFLMFMALSPIMAVGRYIEDRRNGKTTRRKDVAEFRAGLIRHRQRLLEAQAAERPLRAAAHPDLFEMERRVINRSSDLWIRHRQAADFCSLRLGLGSAPTYFDVGVKPGGEQKLHEQAVEYFDGLDRIDEVPVTVHLGQDRVLGIHGPRLLSTTLLSSLVIQAATLHSPEDLKIAVVADAVRELDWVKWLPHVRPEQAVIDGGQLAVDAATGRVLIASLNGLVGQRLEAQPSRTADADPWPRWLIVIDGELDLDKVELDRLLDLGPAAGVSVIWLASEASGIPRQATNIVELGLGAAASARVWSTDAEIAERVFYPELATQARCSRIARSLAPLRDATSALSSTSIPTIVPLFDVLDVERPDTMWVRSRWHSADRTALRGRVGVAASGPVEIDMVNHGPHALIGGTSGAGKSELLQSMVLGLASQHPPEHLNFLFIDYKGGASSQMFIPLPHTIGLVTNLNEAMAMRALESLRAELRYRMTLLEGRAKDLADLVRIDPEAPPSLVIICDEFATLVKEIPDFVAGIIDIAQRGRSLGVHLVLATQRPAGAVNDNILANTNLRIALRTIDKSDSSSIIDTPDAALIAPTNRGRFFMRVGPSSLVEVQSAFSGANLEPKRAQPITMARFDRPSAAAALLAAPGPSNDGDDDEEDLTQLDYLVDVIAAAYDETDHRELRKPWRDPLPGLITMDETVARLAEIEPDRTRSGAEVVLGIADYPAEQDQRPLVVDLARTGGMIVFGSGGSGKSTLLKSLAANASGATEVLVIDGASRPLLPLRDLPNVIDVATADDAESMTRLICVLEVALEARRRGADDLTPLLLLIDDWGQMANNLNEASTAIDSWLEKLQNLITEGRGLGVYTVLTVDRVGGVASRLQSAIGGRLIMYHSDPSNYTNYGVPSAVAKTLDLPPGRGLFDTSTLVQTAYVDVSTASEPTKSPRRRASIFASSRLPERLTLAPRTRARFEPVVDLGIADVTGHRVGVDLSVSDLAIVGHPGSGRTIAIETALASAVEAGYQVFVLSHGDSPLRNARFLSDLSPSRYGFDAESTERVLERLAGRVANDEERLLLGIDDVDLVDESVGAALDTFGRKVRLIGSAEVRPMTGYSTNAAVGRLKRSRNIVFLQPDDPGEVGQLSGARVRIRPGVDMVPGRAILIAKRRTTLFHVAQGFELDADDSSPELAAQSAGNVG